MNNDIPEQVIKKFTSSYSMENFCWIWTGFLDKSGLPVIRISQPKFKEFSPRRISLQLAGKELPPGKHAQPLRCKNKLCVNPDHLLIGDEARFWDKVVKFPGDDACWEWIGGKDKDDYGKFNTSEAGKKKYIRAHQYAWYLMMNRYPTIGLQLCHTCDNPSCVRFEHLFLGTTQDNTQDKVNKNRQAKGETAGRHKLTTCKVREIRELYTANVYTQKQLSKIYGVVESVISAIIQLKIWRHVI